MLSKFILLAAIPALHAETVMTLREAVQRAIANNPEVVAEKASFDAAKPALRAAQGAFDPVLGLRGEWRQATTPATSILQGVNGRLDERSWTQALTTRQRLPWMGMQLDSALENTRLATSNPFTSLNPYYQLNQRTSITIPLLRGRKTDEFRAELKVRRKELKTLRHDFDARLLNLVFRVETAYWSFVAASEAYEAARDVERFASESLDSTARQVKEGEMAETDLAGARGQLSRARENRANAFGGYLEAQVELKGLIAGSPADAIWSENLRPGESRSELSWKREELKTMAIEKHPELLGLAMRLEAQKDMTAVAAEGAKPQVDLSFTHLQQGLAGNSVPQGQFFPGINLDAPPQLIGGFPRAANQALRNRYPTYQATLNIELPIRNRTAEGRLAQQKLLETRIAAQRRQAEIALAAGVEQGWARLESARLRIEDAAAARTASSDRLQSEFRLFREGQSNNLSLNTRQNELAESRQLLVNAWRSFNLAAAELRRLSGQSLEVFQVSVE